MEHKDIYNFLQFAVETAKNAAKDVFQDLNSSMEVTTDLLHDVKIKADTRIEAFIIESLSRIYDYPILSEESCLLQEGLKDDRYCFIVDPLDGSLNFSRGIPICCISIALWKGMEPLAGVVYDFNKNEVFTGITNQGAWLNNHPIKVSSIKEKSKAVLFTGFPVSTNFSKEPLMEFVEDVMEYKKVRLLGSAALSLAYVACGRGDYYRENDIKIWDVAAGLALVAAAGGVINYSATYNEHTFKVNAGNHLLQHNII
jgi:myo-inositol-1(or 4)-monophosphatase